jgi:hypothetical protein
MSFGPRKQIPTLTLWENLVRHLFITFICVHNLILTNFSIKKLQYGGRFYVSNSCVLKDSCIDL